MTPTSPAERLLHGRYRLLRAIGHGAMGTVWEATDELLQRRIAIKEVSLPKGMPAGDAQQLAARTMREARAIGALSHPNVITLYDIIAGDGGPMIVMELMHAPSLAAILAARGRVDDATAAVIGAAVAAGLLAAHAAGITHRDVKPGNVLIAADGRIKLTDFGIARSAGEVTLTATGMLLGSPAYISPEVAAGQPAGPAADAWGLGALLFAAVEGRPPFDRGDPIATLSAVVSDPVPPHPHAGRLGRLIDALLVKDPAARMPIGDAHAVLGQLARDATPNLPDLDALVGTGAPRAAPEAGGARPGFPATSPGGLPPPPWSAEGARGLTPLPAGPAAGGPGDTAPRRRSRAVRIPLRYRRIALTLGVAAAAAVVGFLMVVTLARTAAGR